MLVTDELFEAEQILVPGDAGVHVGHGHGDVMQSRGHGSSFAVRVSARSSLEASPCRARDLMEDTSTYHVSHSTRRESLRHAQALPLPVAGLLPGVLDVQVSPPHSAVCGGYAK